MEAGHPVQHHHVERGGGGPFLVVAADVEPPRVLATVQQRVQHVRVAVEGEDDVRVAREQVHELIPRHPVRVFLRIRDGEEIDDVDHAHAQLLRPLPQPVRRRNGFERRNVAGAAEHHVGFVATVRCPVPDTGAAGAVRARLVHREPLQLRLLVDDDQVHVVAAAQAVIGDGEQAVRVRGQVHARHLSLFRDQRVDEPRPLVGEAVVVVAPARRGEQHVQGSDGSAPEKVPAHLQPLRMLRGHRSDHHGERLVRAEEPVSARQ